MNCKVATALRELQGCLDDIGIGLLLHAGWEYYLEEFLLDLIQAYIAMVFAPVVPRSFCTTSDRTVST